MPRFIWDDNKNQANLKKHGVDFNDAVRAWYDPDRLDFFDEKHSSDEDTVRIISARNALKHEQEMYYAYCGKNS